MTRLRLRPSAKKDLGSIFWYIVEANQDRSIAERFARSLRDQCAHLASLQGVLGRARPELRAGIRSFPYRGYMIFFRYVDDVFEVVNILEGHRDMDAFFGDRED
jgi:plasmid stabilization system protein ParE